MKQETINKFARTPAGRKYGLALMIFVTATLLCAIPPCISVFVYKIQTPLILLSGSEWVTIMSMIGAFYFSANVAQKKWIDHVPGKHDVFDDHMTAQKTDEQVVPPTSDNK